MRRALLLLLLVAMLALPLPALAQGPAPSAEVAAILAEAPPGTRIGLVVATPEGEELLAIAPEQRFVPASNTKIFTTLGGYAAGAELAAAAKGAGVRLAPAPGGGSDVVLVGRGDAGLTDAPDCTANCLATLADAVAAQVRQVHHVVGDDTWFPDERWSPGMSWNNIPTRSGTAISALVLNDNEAVLTVTAGVLPGGRAVIAGSGYFTIDNGVRTVPGTGDTITLDRLPDERVLRLQGTIGVDSGPVTLRGGIDDPAHHAAWHFARLLRQRGVTVTGEVQARHRPLTPGDDPAVRGTAPAAHPPEQSLLAELPPLPLAEDARIINKVSQNLHAELLLRRIGRLHGSGSIADGQAALHAVLDPASGTGSWYLADGSGMSNYNRVTPRGVVAVLQWAARQPWGAAWRDTLPVAGQDGTLRARFAGTPLAGRLFAKTGSINAARALSGYMQAASGRVLVFSALANDMPPGSDGAASAVVDRALRAIAAVH